MQTYYGGGSGDVDGKQIFYGGIQGTSVKGRRFTAKRRRRQRNANVLRRSAEKVGGMQTFYGELQGLGALYDKICPKSPKRIRRLDGHLCVAEKGKEKREKR